MALKFDGNIKFNYNVANNSTNISSLYSDFNNIDSKKVLEKMQNATETLDLSIDNFVNKVKTDSKETFNIIQNNINSIIAKITDKEYLKETGADIVNNIKSMGNNISDLFDSFYISIMGNKITETTLADGSTIQYDKSEVVKREVHVAGEDFVEETTIYYLHGKEVGKLQPNGDLFVESTNTLYLSDGSYIKISNGGRYDYSYDYENDNTLYLQTFDGVKYNPDGTYEVGCTNISNIRSDVSRKVYNLDNTISCYNAEGELLGIYDKNGNVINEGESYYKLKSISDFENAEFDYENCVFKINESIDGNCDYYTIGGDNKHTFYNNDGSYYKIGYYHYKGGNANGTGYVSHTYSDYYSDEDMNSMSMFTDQNINYKSITTFDAEGNRVSTIIHDVRDGQVVFSKEY